MRSRLVVVRALTAVVSQVKRGLHGLVEVRAVGVVPGGAPLRVHVVHLSFLCLSSLDGADGGKALRKGLDRWIEESRERRVGWNFADSLAEER
jgi:hypothetical protein